MMEQASLTIRAILLAVFKEVSAAYSFVLITVLFATPFGQFLLPVRELAEISILAAGLLHPQIAELVLVIPFRVKLVRNIDSHRVSTAKLTDVFANDLGALLQVSKILCCRWLCGLLCYRVMRHLICRSKFSHCELEIRRYFLSMPLRHEARRLNCHLLLLPIIMGHSGLKGCCRLVALDRCLRAVVDCCEWSGWREECGRIVGLVIGEKGTLVLHVYVQLFFLLLFVLGYFLKN